MLYAYMCKVLLSIKLSVRENALCLNILGEYVPRPPRDHELTHMENGLPYLLVFPYPFGKLSKGLKACILPEAASYYTTA